MSARATACPLDCPDLCSLEVGVEDGRVTSVAGTSVNPYTDGLICGKVRKFTDHMYGASRLTTPLIRRAAGLEPASWDEAMTRIAAELRRARDEFGGESILPFNYGGSNGWLTHQGVDLRLFWRLGASRLARTFCAVPSSAAAEGIYGGMPGVALDDYACARMIIVWGCNPSATGIHLVPRIREAQRAGAKLVVVDPRAIPIARGADLHIAPVPGTDMVVALGLVHHLFETGGADLAFLEAHANGVDELRRRASEWPLDRVAQIARVSATDLRTLAEWYVEANPAVLRCGWGVERNRNGGGAVASILAIPAVAGKLGVRGGGFTMGSGSGWGVDRLPSVAATEPDTREINMVDLGPALCDLDDPPIRALFVYNSNPVATAPDQNRVIEGLRRDDLFTVVYDQVMTDTAELADVVLPATTFLEHRELRRGYGSARMFDMPVVADRVGQSRPNYEVFVELIDRLGLTEPGDLTEPDALIAAMIDTSPDADELRTALASGVAERPGGATPVPMVDEMPSTPSGRIELVPADLDAEAPGGLHTYRPDPGTGDYPLALISPALATQISSTFGQLRDKPIPVLVHPSDARARGIEDGAVVRVFNDLGEVVCAAAVTDEVRPGVALLPKGMWRKHSRNGSTANALAPSTKADLGGGAAYNDARVQIELAK